MKRSNVYVPAVLILIFLLNSFFVLKGNNAYEKPTKEGQSCSGVMLGDKWLIEPFAKDHIANVQLNETGNLSIQEAPNDGNTPGKRVNFYIAILKNNSLFSIPVLEYMYKSVQEADLQTILRNCNEGDIIFLRISEPWKYDPNLQRIKVERIKKMKGEGKC